MELRLFICQMKTISFSFTNTAGSIYMVADHGRVKGGNGKPWIPGEAP
jgi:hypothetical protein